ncbi:MAG: TetR/AcrR family transcriptional regulator [Terricaulis sp.]
MTQAVSAAKAVPRRGAEMRDRILSATIACLTDVGYARASTWEICRRAEVSRGAFLHHFPTRIALFRAAIARLTQGPLEELDSELATHASDEAASLFLKWLWSTLDGPMFAVGLELLTAARTEPELQRVLRAGGDQLAERLNGTAHAIADAAPARQRATLEAMLLASIPMVRGIGLDLAVGGARGAHQAEWKRWTRAVLRFAERTRG